MRGGGRILRAVVLSCCAAAGLAGCVSGAPGSQSTALPDRTVSAPASTAATGDQRELARQAYLGMWQAFVAASRTADYQSASLAHYAAGDALSLLTRGLYQNHRNGIVTRGRPSFHPDVTIASSNGAAFQATVVDCADSSHWVDYYKSGKPAPGEAQGRQRIHARLRPFDGEWKVTYLVVEKVGTC